MAGSATVEVLTEKSKASIGTHSTIDASSTTSGVNPSVSVQAENDTTILGLAGTSPSAATRAWAPGLMSE